MNRLQWLGVLVGTIWMTAVIAEESESKSAVINAEQQPENKSPTATTAKRTEKEKDKETPDTFIPTEDISEDLSVSYPVDI